MRRYCRVYHLGELRKFPGWKENEVEHKATFSDETPVYLWDDFTVVESPIVDQGNLFDDVTSQWKEFCQQTLEFTLPEDLQYIL
ncbi:MAG TPA: hypothetical protein VL485_02815 [Ktedonobacteraceae bacterium]|jgi:hypothetical protein|nr:hypothetical protein [Ktedonobacteraceae bacterium]